MGRVNYVLSDLCYDPTHRDVVFATAKHGIIKFDWSSYAGSATASVYVGGPSSGKKLVLYSCVVL